jgi:hypothetical protein
MFLVIINGYLGRRKSVRLILQDYSGFQDNAAGKILSTTKSISGSGPDQTLAKGAEQHARIKTAGRGQGGTPFLKSLRNSRYRTRQS